MVVVEKSLNSKVREERVPWQ